MSKKVKIATGIVSVILLGFLRDYLFYNINWIYLTLVNGRMNQARDEFYFLLNWTPDEINVLKFVLTGVFILLFYLVTAITLRWLFELNWKNRILLGIFIIPACVAMILVGIGKMTGFYAEFYGAIHALMTFIQSFLPLMILGLLFSFLPEEKVK
jgi:hypothetical protein